MQLLHTSIEHDGYTQPIVTYWEPEKEKYIIVDGFHRYFVGKKFSDVNNMVNNRLPIVVIDKPINDRMASTVRHNRARGKHSVKGMSNMVFEMLQNGWKEADIANELGMEAEEVARLKHITGFSKLFENHQYSPAWKTKNQLKAEKSYKDSQNED
jgi:ParB-like chromosome segregation protein Spo0J